MRQQRQIRNRTRRKRGKSKNFDLDITSLLDVLVILLVFLLRSYNSSGLVFTIPDEIKLPNSESQSINSTGIIIHVSQDNVWVDEAVVYAKNKLKSKRNFDHSGKRLIPLYNELVKKKNRIEEIQKRAPNAKPFSGVINLVVDKSIGYNFLKKILYTAAEAGFKSYKFVVLGEEL